MFVKTDLENNIETFPYSLDMFRDENKNTSLPKFLNNRFLGTKNVFPVYMDSEPEYDNIIQRLLRNRQPALSNSIWLLGWNIIAKSEDEITSDYIKEKSNFLKEINVLRNSHMHQTYTVVINGTSIPVDVREATLDLSNISNLVLGATLKKMSNNTSTIIFRDANDNDNVLTPDEVIILGTIISNMVTDTYEQSWVLKALANATTDAYQLREINIAFTEYVHV
jgi:hypothetical protein